MSGWKDSELDQLEPFEGPQGRRWPGSKKGTGSGLSENGRYRTDAKHRELVLSRNREWERQKSAADPEWRKQRNAKKNAARRARRAAAKNERK